MGVKNICCAIVIVLDLLAAACSIAADDKFADPWTIYLLLAVALTIWGLRGNAERIETVRDGLTLAGAAVFAGYLYLSILN